MVLTYSFWVINGNLKAAQFRNLIKIDVKPVYLMMFVFLSFMVNNIITNVVLFIKLKM